MSRRTSSRLISYKGGNNVAITEEKSDDGGIRYCSRRRCCACLHSMRETQKEKSGRCKTVKSSSQSRSSSKLVPTTDRPKPCPDEQLLNLHTTRKPVEESTNAQTCDKQGLDLSDVEHNSLHGFRWEENEKSNMNLESSELKSLQGFSEGDANGHRTSVSTSSSRSSSKQVISQHKRDHQESKSSIRCNSTSRTSRRLALVTSQDAETGVSRNGFRNFRHSARSDISSPAPSTDSGLNRRADTKGKRLSNGEIFSAAGKRTTGSVSRGNAGSSDGWSSSSTSSRNQHSRTSFLTAQTRRAARRDARSTVEDSSSSSNHLATRQLTQDEILALPIIPTGWSSDDDSPRTNTNGQPRMRNRHVSPLPQIDNYPAGVEEVLLESDGIYQHENEMLPESESLEQHEYEQYLAEESRFFLDRFDDQHSDMRMDIDDMSYEELLALGERIGTVSTALSEEVISKCLKRSNYVTECLVSGDNDHEEDDMKCCVCQEEYVLGDELGELGCQHYYHLTCIQQWLQLKNWCPVCKGTVSPTS